VPLAGALVCGSNCSALLWKRVHGEGDGSAAVRVGSRSKRDRSGSALVGGALLGVRRRCDLHGDARRMTVRSVCLSGGVHHLRVGWLSFLCN
jgi:hypothetical protein